MKATTGGFIKTKRDQKGWSQEELAEKVGVSRNAVSAWENDSYMPKHDKIVALAEVLEVKPLDIYAGEVLPDMDEATREALENKIKSLNEQVDNVQNVTINIEDQGIISLDVAITALAFAFFATAMGIWAVFPHNIPNTICCWVFALLGIVVLVFGKRIVRILDKQLKERSQKK